MLQYPSRRVAWVVALLVVAPAGIHRLAAGEAVSGDGNRMPPPSSIEEPGAPPATPAEEQPEVLSRGPVHEAFAEPVNLQLQSNLVTPDRPPPGVEEVPPADRPQGGQFVWIPGYWAWDADRNGYIWVSGCWRAAPPRMSWVPGYWSQAPNGWEWVTGFWTPAGVREIEYLPVPPAIGDMGPPGPPPSPDTVWVPPCMYWAQGRYVPRAGYWLTQQPNWVWVPSHYVATPRGFVFAEGHWDYAFDRRGVLFAPVSFATAVYGRPGLTLFPSIALDMGLLRLSLFAYPRYCHYYFGDYYDDAYLRIGIYPRFDSRRLHTWYDPTYEHDRWWNQRSEPRWEDRERDAYNRRRADTDLRPARTYREQESRLARLPEPQRRASRMALPMTVVVTDRDTPLKFERSSPSAQRKVSSQAEAVRTFRDQRNRWESTIAGPLSAPPKEFEAPEAPPGGRHATTRPPKAQIAIPPPTGRQRPEPQKKPPKPTVTAPDKREEAAQPVREHTVVVTPPQQRREPKPTPKQEPAVVVTPPPLRREPGPTPKQEPTVVVTPPPQRRESKPTPKQEPTVVVTPQRKGEPVPTPKRELTVAPSRKPDATRPERVRIPTPPVVGGSGAPGLFRRGAPARPASEDEDSKHGRGADPE